MCFSEMSTLTFGFQKCRDHVFCLTKMTKLYPEMDNSVTNFHFTDINYCIRKTESNQYTNFQIFNNKNSTKLKLNNKIHIF